MSSCRTPRRWFQAINRAFSRALHLAPYRTENSLLRRISGRKQRKVYVVHRSVLKQCFVFEVLNTISFVLRSTTVKRRSYTKRCSLAGTERRTFYFPKRFAKCISHCSIQRRSLCREIHCGKERRTYSPSTGGDILAMRCLLTFNRPDQLLAGAKRCC
jgi:hypothetical protein